MKKLAYAFLILLSFTAVAYEFSGYRSLKEAEQTAQGLAIAWQNEEYGNAYDYLVPNLQLLKPRKDFVKAAQEENKFSLIYDKVILQGENMAYAYYTLSEESELQSRIPALEMQNIGGKWRFNAFAGYFRG